MSMVLVVWATFGILSADPNDFLSRLVTMDETVLYHYDPETKQRSMKWWHSCSRRSKKFRAQKSAGKLLASIFWDQDGILLIRYLPNGQTINTKYLLISAGATEGHFEGKMLREGHQGGLVLARQRPSSPGTCNPEETGLPGLPVSWSPTLFSGSGPVGLPPVLWTEKTIEWSPFFNGCGGHCCCGNLVGRTTFWIFLSGLQKLDQGAKKCTGLHGEYVE